MPETFEIQIVDSQESETLVPIIVTQNITTVVIAADQQVNSTINNTINVFFVDPLIEIFEGENVTICVNATGFASDNDQVEVLPIYIFINAGTDNNLLLTKKS